MLLYLFFRWSCFFLQELVIFVRCFILSKKNRICRLLLIKSLGFELKIYIQTRNKSSTIRWIFCCFFLYLPLCLFKLLVLFSQSSANTHTSIWYIVFKTHSAIHHTAPINLLVILHIDFFHHTSSFVVFTIWFRFDWIFSYDFLAVAYVFQ